MSIESIVDAVIESLQVRRRISDEALQSEFALDTAQLAELRIELITRQRVARDEAGGAMVWTGATAPPPNAERRQLTVMFCDLVGSTRLSSRLDPEDLRDIMRSYHDACASVLGPMGGHIAQYLGDGLLVYFGYPAANEDDAERAVRAGLSIVEAVRQLGRRMKLRAADGLAARVGIHTGLVVVGDLGDARNPSALALGEAPNLAAHIQGAAAPDTVLVSHATLGLLPPRFIVEDLGPVVLKDPANPIRLARIRGEQEPDQRPAARLALVDPSGHLERLQGAWASARAGTGLAVEVLAEAGLGKTRLTDELCARAAAEGGTVRVLRCSAFHRQSALHPIAQCLLQRAGVNPESPGDEMLPRLVELLRRDGVDHPDPLPLLAALVGRVAHDEAHAPSRAPAVVMQSLQALLLDWVRAATRTSPAVIVWEDLHWADPSTLALLKLLLEGPPQPGLLTLVTARPEFVPPWRPASIAASFDLVRMSADHIRRLIEQAASGHALAAPLVDRIVEIAEGVPLYAEQITLSVINSVSGAASVAANVEVPATLHASLMARLDRMGPAKSVAQTAALLGREFSIELLDAVCELSGGKLARALAQLTAADILQQVPDALPPRYSFRHALLQAEAGDSLLRSARRAAHGRIAQVLKQQFAKTVEAEPETLARHFTEAGLARPAILQWLHAGEHALARSAVPEALSHLQQGMALLDDLEPGTDRDALELSLQIPLASALRAVQGVGAPATGEAYERACTLARELSDQARLIPALNGLYSYHLVSARYDAALAPAQQLLDTARINGDRLFEMIGHRAVGAVAFHVGDPATAAAHLERALALYEPERHAPMAFVLGIDHRVMASNFLALTRMVQGESDAARQIQGEGLAWAEKIDHAHSLAQALVFYCLLLSVQEDWSVVAPLAERTIQVSRSRGFPVMESGARFFLGAARAFSGEPESGLQVMQESSVRWWATGIRNYRPFSELLLARVHARCGDLAAARARLADARRGIAETGERWIEAEMWRLCGELLDDDPEADLRRALSVAQAQKAACFVRRASASLAAKGLA